MGIFDAIILTVTIGVVVIVAAYAIITKVVEEQRKNSKIAEESLIKLVNELPNAISKTVKAYTDKLQNEEFKG